MFDKARYNSLFYMYSGRAKRVAADQLRGDCGVVHDRIYCRQGGPQRDVHRVWLDRRPDGGGRWLNGINSVYPRVPPLDVMSSLRASFPGGG